MGVGYALFCNSKLKKLRLNSFCFRFWAIYDSSNTHFITYFATKLSFQLHFIHTFLYMEFTKTYLAGNDT